MSGMPDRIGLSQAVLQKLSKLHSVMMIQFLL